MTMITSHSVIPDNSPPPPPVLVEDMVTVTVERTVTPFRVAVTVTPAVPGEVSAVKAVEVPELVESAPSVLFTDQM
jgi:hypothetical protein